MPSSKYHREQAKILAGLALSTTDAKEVERFTLSAMEHLERAQAIDDADIAAPPAASTEQPMGSRRISD